LKIIYEFNNFQLGHIIITRIIIKSKIIVLITYCVLIIVETLIPYDYSIIMFSLFVLFDVLLWNKVKSLPKNRPKLKVSLVKFEEFQLFSSYFPLLS